MESSELSTFRWNTSPLQRNGRISKIMSINSKEGQPSPEDQWQSYQCCWLQKKCPSTYRTILQKLDSFSPPPVCLGPSLHKEQSHILFYLFEHFMIYVFVLVRSHLQWLLCYHISLIISMYHRIDSNILSTKFINRHSSFLIRD